MNTEPATDMLCVCFNMKEMAKNIRRYVAFQDSAAVSVTYSLLCHAHS